MDDLQNVCSMALHRNNQESSMPRPSAMGTTTAMTALIMTNNVSEKMPRSSIFWRVRI